MCNQCPSHRERSLNSVGIIEETKWQKGIRTQTQKVKPFDLIYNHAIYNFNSSLKQITKLLQSLTYHFEVRIEWDMRQNETELYHLLWMWARRDFQQI